MARGSVRPASSCVRVLVSVCCCRAEVKQGGVQRFVGSEQANHAHTLVEIGTCRRFEILHTSPRLPSTRRHPQWPYERPVRVAFLGGDRSVKTADVHDERGDGLDSLALQFQNFGGRLAFDGPVRTVRCFRDNGIVKAVLATPGHGAVLIVDGGGSLESALVGDNIALAAVSNGWVGIIVHGAIRDRDLIGGLAIGVKAMGTNPRRSEKRGVGEVDVAIKISGVTFVPGKHVWADLDGVLVER